MGMPNKTEMRGKINKAKGAVKEKRGTRCGQPEDGEGRRCGPQQREYARNRRRGEAESW